MAVNDLISGLNSMAADQQKLADFAKALASQAQDMASRVAVDASQLYARNLLAFLALIVDKEGKLRIDTADEIVKAALLTLDGAIVNPALAPEPVAVASTS